MLQNFELDGVAECYRKGGRVCQVHRAARLVSLLEKGSYPGTVCEVKLEVIIKQDIRPATK
jgi:hypothetical protein